MTRSLHSLFYILTITLLVSSGGVLAHGVFENDETSSLQGARPTKKTEDPAELIRKGGGLTEVSNAPDSLKNIGQQEDELTRALEQGDIGIVPSEAVKDSGATPGTMVNKNLPQVSAKSKPNSRLNLKNVPQMLKKYLIAIPELFNWWQYHNDSTLVPNP